MRISALAIGVVLAACGRPEPAAKVPVSTTEPSLQPATSSAPHEDEVPTALLDDSDGPQPTAQPATSVAPKITPPITGSVNLGALSSSGGTIANKAATVARMRSRFRKCYLHGLANNPYMQGSVTLTAKIGEKGQVLGVHGGGSKALKVIIPCFKAVVSASEFSPPEGMKSATVMIPLSCVKAN